jgi:exopolysaccharide production protein ExoZ
MVQIVRETVHSETPRTQLLSIQYLRAIAALSVLVTHALQWPLPEMNMYLLKTGRLGVEVFFVISGFIITTIAGDGPFHPRVFLERRAHRIIPTYWAATFLVAVLAIALPDHFRTTVPTIEGLLKSLLFIPSQEPKAPLLLLGWTLNFEVFFYLVFASLFFLRSGARTVVLLVCFTLLVGVGQFGAGLTYVEAIYTSPSLIGFGLGTILAQAYRPGTGLPAWMDHAIKRASATRSCCRAILPAVGVLRHRLGQRGLHRVVETSVDVVLRLEHRVACAALRDDESGG